MTKILSFPEPVKKEKKASPAAKTLFISPEEQKRLRKNDQKERNDTIIVALRNASE